MVTPVFPSAATVVVPSSVVTAVFPSAATVVVLSSVVTAVFPSAATAVPPPAVAGVPPSAEARDWPFSTNCRPCFYLPSNFIRVAI